MVHFAGSCDIIKKDNKELSLGKGCWRVDSNYMIYPKQFRAAKVPVQKNRCFFIMPFQEKFDLVYSTVREHLIKDGFQCYRADDLTGSKPIMQKIMQEILQAQYIIADLTDCNPNVFYELGIAHTFKDAENVLLIKQADSKVPLDIGHLQYQEYTASNPRFLADLIKHFITERQYLNNFTELLSQRGVTTALRDNSDAFLEYVQGRFEQNMIVRLTTILEHCCKELSSPDIEECLDYYQRTIHHLFNHQRLDLLPGALKLYQELLISCDAYPCVSTFVSAFLGDSIFSSSNLPLEQVVQYQTDMAVALASRRKQFAIVMPWIIRYFSQSKAASVDLNRYKLESFLMTTDYQEVNEAMINALFSDDCHVREHMADIIGEKHLNAAGSALRRQLIAEENYYTAVSIMEAIGKIGCTDGILDIEKWLEINGSKVISDNMFSVFRHAQNAIIRLDVSLDGVHRKKFNKKYGKHITEQVPL